MQEQTGNSVFGRQFLRSRFQNKSDFTVFFTDDNLEEDFKRNPGSGNAAQTKSNGPECWKQYCRERTGLLKQNKAACSFQCSFEFEDEICGSSARLQVSRCYDRRAWSVSVRWDPPGRQSISPPVSGLTLESSRWKPPTGYKFEPKDTDTPTPQPKLFLFSLHEIIDVLYQRISEADGCNQGLILVTGATNSAKSKTARGLSYRFLEQACSQHPERNPHLVTHENPIEQYFWEKGDELCSRILNGEGFPIDYTPRKEGIDTKSLKETLKGALRQTPAVMYVGEIRSEIEMRRTLEFGGTGHLIVATAHAGSLLEAISKILRSVEANHPGTRALYAPKILGVIRLGTLDCRVPLNDENIPRDFLALVPTMYRRTSQGLQGLVADGLVSIIPYYPEGPSTPVHGSLGRQYFARTLCDRDVDEAEKPKSEEARKLKRRWYEIRKWSGGQPRSKNSVISEDTSACESKRLVNVALREDLHGR